MMINCPVRVKREYTPFRFRMVDADTVPTGLIFDEDTGNLISCDDNLNVINFHKGVSNVIESSIAHPNTVPADICIDYNTGNLITTAGGTFNIHSGKTATVSSTVNPGTLGILNGCVVDPLTGNLILVDTSSNTINVMDGISGTVLSSFAAPGTSPRSLTIANGNLISTDGGTHDTYVHDGISSTITDQFQTASVGTLTTFHGVAFDTINKVLITNSRNNWFFSHDGISEYVGP